MRDHVRPSRSNDRAVSPVIGVILMVAITVILAAVVGAFVMDVGNQVGDETPQASFTFEFTEGAGASANAMNVTHEGGDTLERDELVITVGGTTIYDDGSEQGDVTVDTNWDTEVSAGGRIDIREDGGDVWSDGDDLRIIWDNPSNGKTTVVAETTVDF